MYQPLEASIEVKEQKYSKLIHSYNNLIRNTQYKNRHIVISNHKVEGEGIKG